MTEKRFAFDVGERVIDTARDFTTGTVVRQLKLDNYHHGYNPLFNMYEVQWDGRPAGFLHQARESELRTACLPVIGAVVAMVAASQVKWTLWGRLPTSDHWVSFGVPRMRSRAEDDMRWERFRGSPLVFRVLPEGVLP